MSGYMTGDQMVEFLYMQGSQGRDMEEAKRKAKLPARESKSAEADEEFDHDEEPGW